MFSEMLCKLVLMGFEVVRVGFVITPLDLVIVVVQRFSLNVLIHTCQLLMAEFQIDSSLFVAHRFHLTFNLVIVIPCTNGTPPHNHLQSLPDCAAP